MERSNPTVIKDSDYVSNEKDAAQVTTVEIPKSLTSDLEINRLIWQIYSRMHKMHDNYLAKGIKYISINTDINAIECGVQFILDYNNTSSDVSSVKQVQSTFSTDSNTNSNNRKTFDGDAYLSGDTRQILIDTTLVYSFDMLFGILFASNIGDELRFQSYKIVTNILTRIGSIGDSFGQRYSIVGLWSLLTTFEQNSCCNVELKTNDANSSKKNAFSQFTAKYPGIKEIGTIESGIEQFYMKNRCLIDIVMLVSDCLKENIFAKLVLYSAVYLNFGQNGNDNEQEDDETSMTNMENDENKNSNVNDITITGGMQVDSDELNQQESINIFTLMVKAIVKFS